jgi:hypothetical protein
MFPDLHTDKQISSWGLEESPRLGEVGGYKTLFVGCARPIDLLLQYFHPNYVSDIKVPTEVRS